MAPLSTVQGLPTGWTAGGVYAFTIAAADDRSGVARTLYRLNGGEAHEYGGAVPVIASETTWIEYWSVDAAGNVEAPRTAVIRVDTGRPITTVSGLPPEWSAGDVVLTLSGESPNAPLAGTYYRLGAGEPATYAGPVTMEPAPHDPDVQLGRHRRWRGGESHRAGADRSQRSVVLGLRGVPGLDNQHGPLIRSLRSPLGRREHPLSPERRAHPHVQRRTPGDDDRRRDERRMVGDRPRRERRGLAFRGRQSGPRRSFSIVSGIPAAPAAGPVTFSLTAMDPYSGVARIRYRLGGAEAVDYTAPVAVASPGDTALTYWAVDQVGNTEAPRSATIRISQDAEPAPVTTHTVVPATPGSSGWYVATPTVTITRDIAGLTYFKAASDAGYTATPNSPYTPVLQQGDTTYSYFGVSSLGVTETPAHDFSVKLDTRAPVTTDDAVPTYVGSATIHLTAIDPAPGSGVADVFWGLDGAPSAGATVTTSIVGHHVLGYGSVDRAGNFEEHRSVSFDMTSPSTPAPVTSHAVAPPTPGGSNGWYVATPTVTISRDIAGLTYFKAASDAGYTATPSSPYTPVLQQGDTTYSYFGVSSLGVTETPAHTFAVKLDTRPPVTTDDAAASYTGSANITLTAVDPAPGSGVSVTLWSLDSATPGSGPTVTTSVTGTHVLRYSSLDNAGNGEGLKTVSFEVTIPATPAPVTSHTVAPATPGGSNGWYVATPTVTITRDIAGLTYFKAASDPGYTSTPSSPYTPMLQQGDTTYSYFGVSSLGVTETPAHTFAVKLDTRPPSTTDDAAASYAGSATIHLTAIDPSPGSGVAGILWSLDSVPGTGPTVTTSAAGSHLLRYSSLDNAGNSETVRTVSFEVTGTPPSVETSRMPGADRYKVARNMAIEAFPGLAGTRHVIIACGSDRAMADPLSASGLAGVYNAPVLLVQNDRRVVVPAATLQTLSAMKSANGPLAIHIVGGPTSVTPGQQYMNE